jgi:uncharacterized membrane protein YeaQ/YmgE (transglycosylase-associated protein family)
MILTIVIGFVVGVIARWIKPGARRMGWVLTTLLGVLGAVVATWLGQQLGWYAPGDRAGVLASIAGAVLVLVVYERANGRVPDDARRSDA